MACRPLLEFMERVVQSPLRILKICPGGGARPSAASIPNLNKLGAYIAVIYFRRGHLVCHLDILRLLSFCRDL